MTAKKKPAKKRTVTAWVFATDYYRGDKTPEIVMYHLKRVAESDQRYMTRTSPRSQVGPIVRIEVPLPSRGTR